MDGEQRLPRFNRTNTVLQEVCLAGMAFYLYHIEHPQVTTLSIYLNRFRTGTEEHCKNNLI